jgi:hypothetical protein
LTSSTKGWSPFISSEFVHIASPIPHLHLDSSNISPIFNTAPQMSTSQGSISRFTPSTVLTREDAQELLQGLTDTEIRAVSSAIVEHINPDQRILGIDPVPDRLRTHISALARWYAHEHDTTATSRRVSSIEAARVDSFTLTRSPSAYNTPPAERSLADQVGGAEGTAAAVQALRTLLGFLTIAIETMPK